MDRWYKTKFIAFPIFVIALHLILSNILYYTAEKLVLDIFHIPKEQFAKFSYLGEVFVYAVLILVFFTIYKLVFAKDKAEAKLSLNPTYSVKCLVVGVGVSGVSLLWIMLAEQLPALKDSLNAMNMGNENIGGGSFLGAVVVAVIGAPLIEEIVFRGIVFRSLRRVSPPWVAILVSSVLFGLYHMNTVQIVYATLMGLVAGIIYEKSNNLLFPILVHVANNLVAAIQGFIPFESGDIIMNVISLIMIIPMGYIVYRILPCQCKKDLCTKVSFVKY
jgi:hypothetical protein